MTQHISLREANQYISRYIQVVEQGEEIIITCRSQPVTKLTAVESKRRLNDEQQAALERLRQKMRRGHSFGGERFDRNAAHER